MTGFPLMLVLLSIATVMAVASFIISCVSRCGVVALTLDAAVLGIVLVSWLQEFAALFLGCPR